MSYRDFVDNLIISAKEVYSTCWKIDQRSSLYIILSSILLVTLPFTIAYNINLVVDAFNTQSNSVITLLYIVMAQLLIITLSNKIYTYSSNVLSFSLEHYYTKKVNQKFQNLPIFKYEDSSFIDEISLIKGNYVNRPKDFFLFSIKACLAVIELIISIILLAKLSVMGSLFVSIALIISLAINIDLGTKAFRLWLKNFETQKRFGHVEWMFTYKHALKEMKIYKAKDFFVDKLMELMKEYIKRSKDIWRRKLKIYSLSDSFPVVISILYLSSLATLDTVTVGLLTFYLILLQRMVSSFSEFTNSFSSSYEHSIFIRNIHLFLQLDETKHDTASTTSINTAKPPLIEFKDVWFRYPFTKEYIFKNFNFKINPGDKIALVGENGAGKSTLSNLLMKFYEPEKGEILVNGVNLNKISGETWYDITIMMMQVMTNYNFNVKDFITLGQTYNEERFNKALEKSQSLGFVSKLDHGKENYLGKYYTNGAELSGGQWQRLTLARALYRDGLTYVLDEPTSSLDPEAELNIFEELEHYMKEKTLIYISHRFSTILRAERIVYLENGRIIMDGTHEKLLEENEKYRLLYKNQLKALKTSND